jgi:hypothetical protein
MLFGNAVLTVLEIEKSDNEFLHFDRTKKADVPKLKENKRKLFRFIYLFPIAFLCLCSVQTNIIIQWNRIIFLAFFSAQH